MRLVFKDWLSVLLSPIEANRLKINLKDENCSSNGYLLIGESEVEDVSINNCFKSDVFWGKKPTTTCSVSKHNAHDDDGDTATHERSQNSHAGGAARSGRERAEWGWESVTVERWFVGVRSERVGERERRHDTRTTNRYRILKFAWKTGLKPANPITASWILQIRNATA